MSIVSLPKISNTLQTANIAWLHAFVVHALSDEAKKFYEQFCFQPVPSDPMITLKDAQKNLA